jgi:hypothetical protein
VVQKYSLQEVQITHTAPFLGTQKADHVQLQIPDKQEENMNSSLEQFIHSNQSIQNPVKYAPLQVLRRFEN